MYETIRGMSMVPDDRVRRWAICERDDYHLRELCDGELIKPNDLIVDVGAHHGIFTAYAHHLFPDALIHAYEIDNENYAELAWLVSPMFGVYTHYAAVVGEKMPTGYSRNISSGCHHVTFNKLPKHPLPRTVTLAQIVEEHGDIKMLKMDCEGSEHFILETASEDGSLSHVGSIALEYHNFFGRSGEELMKLLQQHYSVVVMEITNTKCGLMYASNPR